MAETFRNSQNHKKTWNSTFDSQEIFTFCFPGRVPVIYIFHWISEVWCSSSFIEEIFNIKTEKKHSTWVFLPFYEPLDPGNKIFTTWNVLKSKLYLTCINFWKFHDDLKACLEVIKLPSLLENVKFSVKMQFLHFWPPENSHSLKTNIFI